MLTLVSTHEPPTLRTCVCLKVSCAGHILTGVIIRGLWAGASSDKESVFEFGIWVGFTGRLTQLATGTKGGEKWEKTA